MTSNEMEMHKPSNLRDYIIASLIALSLTAFLGFYLFIRRGYLFDAPASADTLYVPNKVLANAGMIIIAFTFLIGPIVRYFDRFDKWLGYRKEIGIVGGFLVLLHGIVTYSFLPLKFPQAYLNFDSLEFGTGLVGVYILVFLFLISFKRAITLFGGSRWWFLQRWGLRLVILLTLIHVYALKWQSWWRWLQQGAPQTPELINPLMVPASLVSGLFIAWVIIVRLYEPLFIYKNFGMAAGEAAMDGKLKARGRHFFTSSFWTLIIAYFFIFTRWMW